MGIDKVMKSVVEKLEDTAPAMRALENLWWRSWKILHPPLHSPTPPHSRRRLRKFRFLQGNQFIGSVIFLADLPLYDLNIEDNHFSGGIIPEKFQSIRNLWIGGNKFDQETKSMIRVVKITSGAPNKLSKIRW